jgi:hypothetical protein
MFLSINTVENVNIKGGEIFWERGENKSEI